MDDEAAFLRKLLEQPNSDLTRLVYADWLDEQQTPDSVAKAEFLRLIADAELAGRFTDRVQALAQKLDSRWLATVSKLPVENCELADLEGTGSTPLQRMFDFRCPKKWEEMTPTDQVGERFCTACRQTVYYCATIGEAKRRGDRQKCVAVTLSVRRTWGDIGPDLFVGLPAIDPDEDLFEQEVSRDKEESEGFLSRREKRQQRRRDQE